MGLLKKIKMKIAVAISFVIAFTGAPMPPPDDIGGDTDNGGIGGGNNCNARHRYSRAFCSTPYDRDGVNGKMKMWERGSACRPVLHYASHWWGLEDNADYKVELCRRRELCSFTTNWRGDSNCTNRISGFEIADGDEICLSDATGAE